MTVRRRREMRSKGAQAPQAPRGAWEMRLWASRCAREARGQARPSPSRRPPLLTSYVEARPLATPAWIGRKPETWHESARALRETTPVASIATAASRQSKQHAYASAVEP
eukprot:5500605-Prymnesium_polylepis.1